MIKNILTLSLASILFFSCQSEKNIEVYVTTGDKSKTMAKETFVATVKDGVNNVITLNSEVKFQEMDGFGAAMTGSSCYNLLKMTPENRSALLKETFDPIEGYGYSYIRISIGASDFSLDEYTYCDEPGIENFKIHEYDVRDLFPILKEILAINPNVKIMGSPWSPPKWMKINNLKDLKPFDSWTSGQLNPKYYADYALYFVKYIEAMKAEGFDIESITVQNEPLNRGNSMSMFMTWQEQQAFVRDHLGPAFEKANIDTKIIAYDHNYDYDMWKDDTKDQGQYPLKIYEDAEAAKYIDGAAYHAYGGDVSELKKIHEARPDKNIYFTEMSIGLWGDGYSFAGDLMWNMREVCIGTINLHNKAVIMWNYMLDDKHGPDRPGGCDICLGAIDIDSKDYATLTKNSHYYVMAHLSKVIHPGANRIQSEGTAEEGIHYSAFLNPNGSLSLVLLNETETDKEIKVKFGNEEFTHTAIAKSVNSYIWNN